MSKKKTEEVMDILTETFPDAKAELDFSNPFELLIATILSAQCTDVRVNQVTAKLFPHYRTPQDYLDLGQEGLEEAIRSCGFYRMKAKNILGACRILRDDYDDRVPETIKELVKLPGVGKKTANVVASNCFDVPAIAVDTHVYRTARRLGLADGQTPKTVEDQLMKRIRKDRWSHAHHLLIFLGRRICKARKPLCEECPLTGYCQWFQGENK